MVSYPFGGAPGFNLAMLTASVDWSQPPPWGPPPPGPRPPPPSPVTTNSEPISRCEANSAAADRISEKSSSVGVGPRCSVEGPAAF